MKGLKQLLNEFNKLSDIKMDSINKLKPFAKRVETLLTKEVTEPRHFYSIGFFFLILGVFLILVSQAVFNFLTITSLTLFVWGYTIDTYRFIKNIWASNTNKKIITALVGIIITLPTYISANHIINKITGLSPENFDTSIAVLSLFIVIEVTIIVGMGVFFISILYHFFTTIKQAILGYVKLLSNMILLKDCKPDKDEKTQLAFSRIVGGIAFIFMFGYLSDAYNDNQETILPIFENIIVLTDYYEKSPCKDIAPNARIAFLNDGKISVAVQNKPFHWSFNSQTCNKS